MSFAQNLGASLRSFTRGFRNVANQFNCTMIIVTETPPLITDEFGRFVVPSDYVPATTEVKLFLERDRAPILDFEPGTSSNRLKMKGHLVEPRTLPKLPNSQDGIRAKLFRNGGKVDCLLFDLESFPTPDAEAMFSGYGIGDRVTCSLEIKEGAVIESSSIKVNLEAFAMARGELS